MKKLLFPSSLPLFLLGMLLALNLVVSVVVFVKGQGFWSALSFCIVLLLVGGFFFSLRKRGRFLLRHGEWYRTLFDHIQDGVTLLDKDLNILEMNPWMEKIYPGHAHGHQKCYAVYQQRQEPCPFCPVLRALKSGNSERELVPFPNDRAPEKWLELWAYPWRNGKGQIEGVIEVVRNVSALLEDQGEDGHHRHFQKLLISGISEGLWVCRREEGRLIFSVWNHQMESITGYSGEDIQQLGFLACLFPEPASRKIAAKQMETAWEEEFSEEAEWKIARNNGESRFLLVTLTLLKDGNREPYLMGMARDITERKEAELALRNSRERLSMALEGTGLGLWDWDIPTGETYFSPGYVEMMGHEGTEGPKTMEVALTSVHPEDKTRIETELQTYLASPTGVWDSEFRVQTRGGEWKWIRANGKVMAFNSEGEPLRMVGTNKDVTPWKRARQELHQSEERFRVFAESSQALTLALQGERILYANPAVARLTGYSLTEVLRMSSWELFHPEHQAMVREIVNRCLTGGEDRTTQELRCINRRGEIRWLEATVGLIHYQGRPTALMTAFDITQRKAMEDALRASEARLQQVLDNIPQFIYWKDRHLFYQGCNPSYAQTMHLPGPEVIVGLTDADLPLAADCIERGRASDLQVLEAKKPFQEQLLQRRTDGREVWLNISKVPLLNESGEVLGLLGSCEDITEQRRHEEEKNQLIFAIEQSSEAIFITDLEGRIRYVNRAYYRMSGRNPEELTGENIYDMKGFNLPASLTLEIQSSLANGLHWTETREARKEDDLSYQAEMIFSPVLSETGHISHCVVIVRDVTRERELEGQLRHSQKMQAIGTLAGGVSHDFNNILQIILGHSAVARREAEAGSEILRECIEEIEIATRRGARLVEQILTFSRSREEENHPVLVQTVVKESLKLLRNSLPANVEVNEAIQQDCPPVLSDPTKIQQIVMNLCMNAFHAMRGRPGWLVVGLEEYFTPAQDHTKEAIPRRPGRYALLSVEDNGCGMSEEIQKRIFEPYFTTKEQGEGTGLGLATVHGIVESHDGFIEVESEENRGSRFFIFLPICQDEAVTEGNGEDRAPVLTGRESILVVDDEKQISDLIAYSLTYLGYRVETYVHPREALEVFEKAPEAFDALVTDLTMPEMTGLDLRDAILGIRPGLPVILISGYSGTMELENAPEAPETPFLQKPVVMDELAALLRKLLDDGTV